MIIYHNINKKHLKQVILLFLEKVSIIFIIFCFTFNMIGKECKDTIIPQKVKEVSITMDNLALEYQDKIIDLYKKYNVPGAFAAITNEDKGRYGAKKVLSGIKTYFDNGFIVFNHTANHRNASRETIQQFKEDLESGELFINEAIKETNFNQTKYFRFPYLARGKTYEDRVAINNHLLSLGYKVAPITMDSLDWKFNIRYHKADKETKRTISQKFLSHMENEISNQEQFAKEVVGRNIKHILLVHGTQITGDNLEELLKIFVKNGYKFISLDEAMSDPIYKINTIEECKGRPEHPSGHIVHLSVCHKNNTRKAEILTINSSSDTNSVNPGSNDN